MLIDDECEGRERARFALDEAGFTVIEAASEIEAFEHLRDVHVDLVVCDVNVPGLSGVELADTLGRVEYGTPPFILVSHAGQTNLVQAAKACGAKGWMEKPLRPELLVAAARRMTRT